MARPPRGLARLELERSATLIRDLLARPVVANSVAVIALRGSSLAARLLVLFVLARHVPPQSFGTVVFVISIAEIAKVLADFGMDTLAIRAYARPDPPEEHARFAAGLGAAKLLFGTVTFLVLVAWFAFTGDAARAAPGIVAALTVPTALFTGYSLDVFQARLRVHRVVPAVLAANVVLGALAALAVPRLPDLRAQVALLPALELAVGLVLWLHFRAEGLPAGAPAFDRVGALARASLPIAITATLIMLYSRLDVLVLASRIDAASVGVYGVAFRITEPFQIVAASFGLSVFSRFTTWFHDPGDLRLGRVATRYVAATLAYGLAVALLLALVAPPAIERALPAYRAAIPVLRVLAAALVFRTLNATLAGILQGAGRFRLLTGIAGWNLLLVFGLLQAFVPRFGVTGAALALLVGEAVNSAIEIVAVTRVVASSSARRARGG